MIRPIRANDGSKITTTGDLTPANTREIAHHIWTEQITTTAQIKQLARKLEIPPALVTFVAQTYGWPDIDRFTVNIHPLPELRRLAADLPRSTTVDRMIRRVEVATLEAANAIAEHDTTTRDHRMQVAAKRAEVEQMKARAERAAAELEALEHADT